MNSRLRRRMSEEQELLKKMHKRNVLNEETCKEQMPKFQEISRLFKEKGLPLSYAIDVNYHELLKWKTYNSCFTVSKSFWNRLSTFGKWINYFKTCGLELSVDEAGPKLQVGIFCDTEKEWEKAKKDIRGVLVSFFKENEILDFFQGGITIKSKEFPEISKIENYNKKELEMYKIAKTGFEKESNFKVFLLGNTGTGKSFFSQMMSRYLIENKFVDSVVWGTLGSISEIVAIRKQFELPLKFLFVVDEIEMDSASREREDSTSMVIKFFDNLGNLENTKFIGISNAPNIMDPAMFRPGRIDMMIFSKHSKMSEQSIYYIIKSLNKDENIKDKDLRTLAGMMFEKYKTVAMPNSFYALGLKLFRMYDKNLESVEKILTEFFKKKELYDFNDKNFQNRQKMGFENEEPEPEVTESRGV